MLSYGIEIAFDIIIAFMTPCNLKFFIFLCHTHNMNLFSYYH